MVGVNNTDHFHYLSSFVYGCGVTPEIHLDGVLTCKPPSLTTDHRRNDMDKGRYNDNKEFVAFMNAVSENIRRKISKILRLTKVGLFVF